MLFDSINQIHSNIAELVTSISFILEHFLIVNIGELFLLCPPESGQRSKNKSEMLVWYYCLYYFVGAQ